MYTGHFGRLCALCNDSYVLSTEGCIPCENGISETSAVIVTCIVLGIVVWYVTVWRPWLQIFEAQEVWIAARVVTVVDASIGLLKFLLNKIKQRADRDQAIRRQISRLFRFQYFVGYAKLMVGYYQVTASFLSNFGIAWPDMIETMLKYMNFLMLDIFSLPGVACTFKDFSYFGKQQIFTTVPFCIIALFAVPSLLVRAFSNPRVKTILRRNLAPEKDVAESTISAFFFSMLSFLFLIYPVVSSTVLQTFNCIDLEGYGNYLKVDMRVECPKDTQDAGFAWSTVFVVIYPLG
jgi:hypothetical protein